MLIEIMQNTNSKLDFWPLVLTLTETLVVVAMETTPAEFLELIPDDGTAAYFLPHLLACTQKHLLTT